MTPQLESFLPPLWAIDFQDGNRTVLRREDPMREALAYLSIDWAARSFETGYNMAGPIPRLGRVYEGHAWVEGLLLDAFAEGEHHAAERARRISTLKPRPVLAITGTEGGNQKQRKKARKDV